MGSSCSSPSARLARICGLTPSGNPDTSHKARLKDTTLLDIDFGGATTIMNDEDSRSVSNSVNFELDPQHLDVLMKFNQSMTEYTPEPAPVPIAMLAQSSSHSQSYVQSQMQYPHPLPALQDANSGSRHVSSADVDNNIMSSDISHNRRLSSITATAAANANDLRRLKLEIKSAYSCEDDEQYIGDSDDAASDTPQLTSNNNSAVATAAETRSIDPDALDDDLSESSSHHGHAHTHARGHQTNADELDDEDEEDEASSEDEDRNVFRGDTDRAWDAKKLDELHEEMAEELAEMVRRESQTLDLVPINSQRSLSAQAMPVMPQLPLVNQHDGGGGNNDAYNDDDSDDFNLASFGSTNIIADNTVSALETPQSELFRIESDQKWSANAIDKKFKEMEKQMVHLATVNATSNSMLEEEFDEE